MGYEGITLPPANVAADTLTQRANELAKGCHDLLNVGAGEAPGQVSIPERGNQIGAEAYRQALAVAAQLRVVCNAIAVAMAINSQHSQAGGKVDRFPVALELILHGLTTVATANCMIAGMSFGMAEMARAGAEQASQNADRAERTINAMLDALEKATGGSVKVDRPAPPAPGKA